MRRSPLFRYEIQAGFTWSGSGAKGSLLMFPRQSHVPPTLAAKIAKQPRYYNFKGLHIKKTEHKCSVLKNWRLPTLAEAIQPLPSATLRLTAEFGKGSGRTTALWPPKNCKELLSSQKTAHK